MAAAVAHGVVADQIERAAGVDAVVDQRAVVQLCTLEGQGEVVVACVQATAGGCQCLRKQPAGENNRRMGAPISDTYIELSYLGSLTSCECTTRSSSHTLRWRNRQCERYNGITPPLRTKGQYNVAVQCQSTTTSTHSLVRKCFSSALTSRRMARVWRTVKVNGGSDPAPLTKISKVVGSWRGPAGTCMRVAWEGWGKWDNGARTRDGGCLVHSCMTMRRTHTPRHMLSGTCIHLAHTWPARK